jgi:hypothetical protein
MKIKKCILSSEKVDNNPKGHLEFSGVFGLDLRALWSVRMRSLGPNIQRVGSLATDELIKIVKISRYLAAGFWLGQKQN